MSTWPFSPHTAFTDNSVPKVTATHLNDWELIMTSAAWQLSLARPSFVMLSTDGSTIGGHIAPLVMRDNATSKWTYATFPYVTIDSTSVSGGGGFVNSAWHVAYARCTNGVTSIVVEAATNPTILTPDGTSSLPYPNCKSGDDTYRYIFAFYVDGGGLIQRFAARDGVVTWLDDIYVVGSGAGGMGGAVTWQTANTHTVGASPFWAKELDVHGLVYNTSAGADCDLAISYSGDTSTIPRVITASRDASGGPETCGGELTIFAPQYSIQWKTETTSCVVKVKARKWRD